MVIVSFCLDYALYLPPIILSIIKLGRMKYAACRGTCAELDRRTLGRPTNDVVETSTIKREPKLMLTEIPRHAPVTQPSSPSSLLSLPPPLPRILGRTNQHLHFQSRRYANTARRRYSAWRGRRPRASPASWRRTRRKYRSPGNSIIQWRRWTYLRHTSRASVHAR